MKQNTTPDLESLACFLAAASRTSFRAAAEHVHLSPAAFGERIKRLELELGARLFLRTTRSVRLTPAGERLVPAARALLSAAGNLRAAVEDTTEAPFELLIGTRYELGLSWLVPALGELAEDAPARRVHLYFGDSDALLEGVSRGRIDAAITSVRLVTSGLEYAPLHEERYVLAGSPTLLRRCPLARPEHAAAHTLLDARADLPLFRYFLDAAPPEPAWAFGRHEYLGTIAAIRARALEGAGVAVLPEYFLAEDLRAKRIARLFPRLELASDWFRLIWRAGHPRAAELRRLGDSLRRRPLR